MIIAILEMMQESKLTMFQQKHLDKTLKNGKTLPLNVPPTHTYREKIIQPKVPESKVVKVSHSGGLRTKGSMEKMGAFEKPDYKPRPQRCRTDQEKEKLGNIMAYGTDIPPPDMRKVIQRAVPREDTFIDRFDELQNEIDDRREFLSEMIALGQEDKYRSTMESEISQKVREMEVIDRKRTKELEARIEERSRPNEDVASRQTEIGVSAEDVNASS